MWDARKSNFWRMGQFQEVTVTRPGGTVGPRAPGRPLPSPEGTEVPVARPARPVEPRGETPPVSFIYPSEFYSETDKEIFPVDVLDDLCRLIHEMYDAQKAGNERAAADAIDEFRQIMDSYPTGGMGFNTQEWLWKELRKNCRSRVVDPYLDALQETQAPGRPVQPPPPVPPPGEPVASVDPRFPRTPTGASTVTPGLMPIPTSSSQGAPFQPTPTGLQPTSTPSLSPTGTRASIPTPSGARAVSPTSKFDLSPAASAAAQRTFQTTSRPSVPTLPGGILGPGVTAPTDLTPGALPTGGFPMTPTLGQKGVPVTRVAPVGKLMRGTWGPEMMPMGAPRELTGRPLPFRGF